MNSNTTNSYQEETEISLSKLFFSVLSRTPLIVSTTIIFLLATFCLGFITNDRYEVGATININEIRSPGILTSLALPYYSKSQIFYDLKTRDSFLETLSIVPGGEERTYESLASTVSIDMNKDSGLISFRIAETSEPEFYIDFIKAHIQTEKDKITEAYTASLSKALENEENKKKIYLEALENTPEKTVDSTLIAIENNITAIRNLQDSLENNIIYVDRIYTNELPDSFHSVKGLLIGAFLGIFAGCGIAVLLCLIDKRIYTKEDLEKLIPDNRLLTVIPAYKNPEDISENHATLILSKIPEGTKRIHVSSISPKAGKTTIMEKLENKKQQIIEEPSFLENPSIIRPLEKEDANIMVIRAGVDELDTAESIINDFNTFGDSTWYILNYAYYKDNGVIRFSDCRKYKKKNIFLSFRRFYNR